MDQKKARSLYKSSVRIVKENQHKKGGFYASPPGTRYPYVYARDHSIDVLGAISAGMLKQAKRGLKFMFDAQKPSGEFAQRYDVDGTDRSYKELQIDGNGLILFALGKYIEASGDSDFAKEYWDVIKKGANFILQKKNDEVGLIHTINSIHEYPAYEHGFEIYANAACCGGLKKVADISKVISKKMPEVEKAAKEVAAGINNALWSEKRQSFLKNIRIKDKDSQPLGYDPYSSVVADVDAVLYSPAYFEVVPEDDHKVTRSVRRIHDELWDPELRGLNRYPEYWGRNNGGYGPWCHFTAMLARHYIHLGKRYMADTYLGWVVDVAYKNMLPEHISTVERFELWLEEYSNAKILREDKMVMIEGIKKLAPWKEGLAYVVLPLIWPHAEYIMAYNEYKRKFL